MSLLEVSLYRAAYCGPNGVLIIDTPLQIQRDLVYPKRLFPMNVSVNHVLDKSRMAGNIVHSLVMEIHNRVLDT